MICPRCGNEWDATRSPCTRCGLVIRIPGQSGPLGRNIPPTQAGNMQQPGEMSTANSPANNAFGAFPAHNMPSQFPTSSQGATIGPNTPSFPPAAQAPNTPWPFYTSPIPETPRPSASSSSMPDFENNAISNRTFPQTQQPKSNTEPTSTQTSAPHTDAFSSRSGPHLPHRPQANSQLRLSTDALGQEWLRPQNAPRASRLVTDPLNKDISAPGAQGQTLSSTQQQNIGSTAPNGLNAFTRETAQLTPGTILRGGRYRLQELRGRQEWLSGVAETTWIAQDAQRNASQVMMCELVLPDNGSVVMQSTLRTATIALTSVGRHPHIPTLWDAFSDRGRNFFVFELIEGESLLARMRRTGRAMTEQDVIECCLQMTEVLELLAQQSPPLVHGFISPDHIIIGRSGSQFVLTNFSLVLAGGATQFVAGIDRTRLSPYTAPEFVRGIIDVRSDLFSLLATAYHTVTGSIPAGVSGSIPQAQRLNPNVSPQFDAILARALRPVASQRYQRPSELRQDLLAMRSVSGTLVPGTGQRFEPSIPTQPTNHGKLRFEPAQSSVPDSVAQAFQSLAPSEDIEERKLLLPRPEELPPLIEKDDKLHAAIWLSAILIALLLITFLGRGFF